MPTRSASKADSGNAIAPLLDPGTGKKCSASFSRWAADCYTTITCNGEQLKRQLKHSIFWMVAYLEREDADHDAQKEKDERDDEPDDAPHF